MNKISHPLPRNVANSHSSFKSFSKGVSLFTIGMGCLVLGGWALDVTALKSILPGMANMKSNSALLFILAGISLWMQVHRKTPRIAWGLGLIVALVGVLTLGAYLFNSDLGIDQLLFRDTSLSALYPGRMAPFTAMAFLMTGLALMFLNNPSRNPFNESAVIITSVIAGLALVGYAYGVSSLYQVGLYTSMAWHTALSFFLLALAILFARPEQGVMQTILSDTPGGSILRRFLPMAILMPVLLGWLGISGERAGLFNDTFGQALIIIVMITTLTIFIWFNAGQLTKIDLSRQQIRHILQEREVHFGNTLDSMMEGCQILSHDWRYRYINTSAEKQNRRPNQELMGNVYMEMWPGVESTHMFDALRRCMNERTPQRMVNEFTFPDGAKGWFELSIQPVPDGIFILSSDITKRQQAEQALLEREMKLSILFDILPVGISILDAQHMVSYSNPALKKILDISEQELLQGTYQDLKYLRADGALMPVEEYASVRAFKEKREIDDVEMGVVKEDGSIIWTNVSAVPVDFPDWKLVMVISDITERKKVEEMNSHLAAVVESSNDAIISKDLASIIASWNMGAQKLFGYTADEMIGQSILRLIPPDHLQEEEYILNQIAQAKVVPNFETVRLTKEGRRVDVSVTASPIKDITGRVVGVSKVAHDITERKKIQEEARKLEARFSIAFRSSPAGLTITALADGMFVDVNESYLQMLGYRREEVIGHTSVELNMLSPEERAKPIRQLREQGRIRNVELRLRSKSGQLLDILFSSEQIELNGAACVLTILIDITERKQAEEAHRESEVKFSAAFHSSPVALVITTLEGKFIETNQAFCELIGYSNEEIVGNTAVDLGLLSAQDRERLLAVIKDNGGSVNNFEVQFHIRDGSLRDILYSLTNISFRRGFHRLATGIDITERKQAERKIYKLNAELEEKVAERTAELGSANEQLRQLSLFDVLTGLYNRRGFLLIAEEQLLLARRAKRNLIVFYADMDGLKQINDQLGHAAGDEAIAKVARSLSETFRNTDIKARLGGDEFIVMAIEADDDNVESMLQRLREKLAENGQSMSVGVVTYDSEEELLIEDLVAEADRAMYIEKRKKSHR